MNPDKYVIVTTEHRGVFYGRLTRYDEDKSIAELDDAIMAIYWGTKSGLFELASDGPNERSKLSARAPSIKLQKVTGLLEVSSQAVDAWTKHAK